MRGKPPDCIVHLSFLDVNRYRDPKHVLSLKCSAESWQHGRKKIDGDETLLGPAVRQEKYIVGSGCAAEEVQVCTFIVVVGAPNVQVLGTPITNQRETITIVQDLDLSCIKRRANSLFLL